MTALVLFSAHPKHFPDWRRALPEELARRGVDADVLIETDSPESIDYIAYARDGSLKDFSPFTRLKAVLSLWAGIEDLVGNRTISCPVARMVDAAMTEGMTEWVTAQVLRHHLGLDRITGGQDGVWRHELIPPLARNRTVAVLGLGELGCASAASLSSLKFRVIGWSRTPKAIPGIDCRMDGTDSFRPSKRLKSRPCCCPIPSRLNILLMPDCWRGSGRDRSLSIPGGAR